IGSHTVTHRLLARLPSEEARNELSKSRAALEDIIGAPIRWLCYPRGNLSHAVAKMAAEEGYVGACSAIRGNRPRARQLYWLPRVMVMRDMSPARLRYALSWGYELIHRWKNRRRWKNFL
ncbi:MAG: polysaccharide deacetylase family protein, partial [bacterium]